MLRAGAGSLVGAPAILRSAAASAEGKTLYVNSYGGVWESSWRKAFFDPFTAASGITIKTVPGVSFAKLKAEVQTGNYQYDQSNLGDSEYAQAAQEGLLERLDKGAANAAQLPPSLVREFGIVSYSLGTNIVYRKDKFPKWRAAELGGFLEREKISGPALPVRPLVHLSGVCAARRRRAARQALSDGYRSRLPQDG